MYTFPMCHIRHTSWRESVSQEVADKAEGEAARRAAPSGRSALASPILLLALLLARPSLAGPSVDRPRRWPLCQVEQALATGQSVRLLARLVSLSGEQLLHGRPISLRVHGRPLCCEPPHCVVQRKRFAEQRQHPLEVALLVEATLPYQPLFAEMQAALADFIVRLPAESRLRIFLVGAEPPGAQKTTALLSVAEAVSALQAARASGDIEVRLIDTVRAALGGLQGQPGSTSRHTLPARRVLVVVAGGLNTVMVPQRFAQLGDELAQAGVPLFSIALSPRNYQLPMLNLAELSFRSAGTFRWVRLQLESSGRELLREQLFSLAEELNTTELVTFSGPRIRELLAELPADATISLDCGEVLSQEHPLRRLPGLARGSRGWLALLLAFAAAILLAALGWLSRQHRAS